MHLKTSHFLSSPKPGDLFREDARMILANVLFWLAAMALFSCPVWLPAVIEYFLAG